MSFTIFTDFDGTITRQDSLAYVLDKFGDRHWLEIEDRVTIGELTDREALQAQFDLLNIPLEVALEAIKEIPIDNTFPEFYRFCQRHRIPLIVLSGGFECFIRTILQAHGIEGVPFYANRVEVVNNRWKVIPNPGPKINNLCNNCKTYWVKSHRKKGIQTIYIGNGNTDRCPILEADIRFAKGSLAKFLDEKNVPYFPFEEFADVQEVMSQLLKLEKTVWNRKIEETIDYPSHR